MFQTTLFWPEKKASFYIFILVWDSNTDPRPNPDPQNVDFGSGSGNDQMFPIPTDPVADPQH